MRVCDLNNLYSPTGGGVRTYHERKIRYYQDRGDTPYALMVPSSAPSHRQDGPIERFDLPSVALGGSGYGLTVSPSAVAAALRRFQPDVIEVGSAYVMPALVHAALRDKSLRQPRRAVVGFMHANYPDTYVEPLFRKGGKLLGKFGLSLADQHVKATYGHFDATFVGSRHIQNKLEALGVPHVYRTPLGFDPEQFYPERRSQSVRERWGVSKDERLLVFVGRLASDKGIEDLLLAYPELCKIPGVKTVVVGHGPRESEVQGVRARYGGMTLTGFMTDQVALAELYAAADAVLSLGRFETFSLATLEAQASGTPVVAPSEGGAGELVRDAGVGATFESGNAASLVAACQKALATPPEQRQALARWARDHYAWTVSFDRLHQRYEQTLERVRSEAKHD